MGTFLMVVLSILSVFLILLVLIQQGRGGGLAGAFGGLGGQSAFGTRAGDVFTRVTIAVASVWILLCIITLSYFSYRGTGQLELRDPAPPSSSIVQSSGTEPASQGNAPSTAPAQGGSSPDGS